MAWIDIQTESLKKTGQRTGDRNRDRRRKDLEIVVTMAKTNESENMENRVT